MSKVPKSGKVTIRLSQEDVRHILSGHGYAFQVSRTLAAKLFKAASEKFTDASALEVERKKVNEIADRIRASDEYREMQDSFAERRQAISSMAISLSEEQSNIVEKIMQAAFDEAGITLFKASGSGWTRTNERPIWG